MPDYCFIINPMAGRGKTKAFSGRLKDWVKNRPEECTVVETNAPMHAAELAKRYRQNHKVIVAVGGDGTIHEVVNGIIGGSAELAIIPVGTGNDLVKVLEISREQEKAFKAVFEPTRQKKIDAGKANNRYFVNGLGIGFDALVVKNSQSVRFLRGNLVYLFAVLTTLWQYSHLNLSVDYNNKKTVKELFMITVGNGPALGGGFYLTPNAMPDDGLFDLCLIQKMNKFHILKNLVKVYSGTHIFDPRVDMDRTKSIRVTSTEPFPVHVDGEILGFDLKELNVSILPDAVKVRC